jgi:hypothetical protein
MGATSAWLGRQRLIESDIMVDMSTWTLGLNSWIIQDGNYDDFSTGQEVELAVEYWSEDGLRLSDGPTGRSCRPLKDAHYEVVADVVHSDDGLIVIDFGLLASRID